MALKRPQQMMATFSMASMTDVVFLLLVFFMVTSAFAAADAEPAPLAVDSLAIAVAAVAAADSTAAIAVYAHAEVPYGKVVEVLNAGAASSVKMVLATPPEEASQPAENPQ